MVEPVSLTIAIVSVVGTIILGLIQLFQSGITLKDLRSNCCVFNLDRHTEITKT